MVELNPKQIVSELDKYVIGQDQAKKIIAVAFRNRYRRLMLEDEKLKDDIIPKNVLLIGSTGVGKTEIVRRASQICNSPFIKVEATRFTEIGYVGKDVESIIRDLTERAITAAKNTERKKVEKEATSKARSSVLQKLYTKLHAKENAELRSEIRKKFEAGDFDNEMIEIELKDDQQSLIQEVDIPGAPIGVQMGVMSIADIFKQERSSKVKKAVKDAMKALVREYSDELIDENSLITMVLKNVQENGVVFIDEIDKIISTKDSSGRGDVSREGVQRDLLPLVEGYSVQTKYGQIDTRHILFIGCGAFYKNKPSDMLPELQGRFPIKATLKNLNDKDFYKILTSTKNNLIEQYSKMMEIDGAKIEFSDDAIVAISKIAFELNQDNDNIGARRLHAVFEKTLENILYEYPKQGKKSEKVFIDEKFVKERLGEEIEKKTQYSKFIL